MQRTQQKTDLIKDALPAKDSILNNEEKCDIFLHLVRTDVKELLSFAKYTNYKIPNEREGNVNFGEDMLRKMMDKLNNNAVNDGEMAEWLETMNKIGITANLTDEFFGILTRLKSQSEENKKVIKKFIKENRSIFGDSQNKVLLE